MKAILSSTILAILIWSLSSVVFAAGWLGYSILFEQGDGIEMSLLAGVCSAVGSVPVLVVLVIVIRLLESGVLPPRQKMQRLVVTCFICVLPYGIVAGILFTNIKHGAGAGWQQYLVYAMAAVALLFCCCGIALLLLRNRIHSIFSHYHETVFLINQINTTMEAEQLPYTSTEVKPNANKTMVKGLITGALILIMMIPAVFVSNLVTERQQRQQEVVREVSSKWASEQTLTGPYIYIPYTITEEDKDKKPVLVQKHLLLLPDNLSVTGTISPEIRPRSIYKVLLYRSRLQASGNFKFRIPREIDPASLHLQDAKICFGITDFKGIEEKMTIDFNGTSNELSPGLPAADIDENGLAAPVSISAADLDKPLNFDMQIKIKGSEQLHFVPLAGNSQFALQSGWGNPSFDGNNLPAERKVDDSGFAAKWMFNKANLPFGTVLQGSAFDKKNFAFGVSMLQPADQYAKTMRSVKYAILFIGLTFSLFFIVELTQKKPVHPVQYVLVGLALVIFYTLLLSISEFILFDQAYWIASAATILLITLYAKSHFDSWKTAALFGAVLTGLYGFIFVLIRLEDTALLVGSIGLFLVLALVMYASRKINWYSTTPAAVVG